MNSKLNNVILDDEERRYEDEDGKFVPMDNQDELRKKIIAAAQRKPVIHYESAS